MTKTGPEAGHEAGVNIALVVAPLMLGAFAYGVLAAIILPALTLFQRDLHTSEAGATWMLTAYLLSAAVATAILGRLGDMFGKRRMLLITLGILAAGTLVSAVSSTLTLEIVGRVLQGIAGGLFPLAFGIIRDEFPRARVGHGIAAVGSMIALGNVGVVFPGLIVPHLNWHWLFWIPLMLTLLALAGTWKFVRESPVRPGGSVNWVNAGLMVVGFTAAVLGISEGDTWGWTSGKTLGLLGGGIVVCAAWVVAETRSRNPLINMGLLRLRGVWTTNVVAFMIGAGMYSAFAVYPVFAELPKITGFGYGASILRCGLYLLPLPIVSGLTGPFAARLAVRFGAVPMLIASCLVWAAGFAYMAVWSTHPYDMMISIGLMGLGLGVSFNVLTGVVVHSVPARNVGETTGMNTVVRMLGGAIGTQVVVSLIASYHSHGLPAKTGFTLSYAVLAAFLVVAALAALIIAPRRARLPGAGQPGAEQLSASLTATGDQKQADRV